MSEEALASALERAGSARSLERSSSSSEDEGMPQSDPFAVSQLQSLALGASDSIAPPSSLHGGEASTAAPSRPQRMFVDARGAPHHSKAADANPASSAGAPNMFSSNTKRLSDGSIATEEAKKGGESAGLQGGAVVQRSRSISSSLLTSEPAPLPLSRQMSQPSTLRGGWADDFSYKQQVCVCVCVCVCECTYVCVGPFIPTFILDGCVWSADEDPSHAWVPHAQASPSIPHTLHTFNTSFTLLSCNFCDVFFLLHFDYNIFKCTSIQLQFNNIQ